MKGAAFFLANERKYEYILTMLASLLKRANHHLRPHGDKGHDTVAVGIKPVGTLGDVLCRACKVAGERPEHAVQFD
ncbi:hypothetical protein PhaeoP75_03760 (plasmid) [Phaeobacter gallaeciensis]|uniref:Uncharacterized protein n=2 Tax=Phaeobacter gallaeciensis TaxID=60890 RepID=A0AAD0ED51_9RHOB|nr:hypothetical protein Gal_03725 [Phaeobacter gallaeciensis DSM 26640]ATE94698.1 hypothetical protein PhaeoP11_03711 [Phaeobacter gallaeciensis]ATE98970.1 hypothetical protein PhaeoP73_03708 [Phaeobacter gallaeciensis]ATF03362.1 hypothetical protein PhaeoP75_03760 [Phaeobacter gallaeciensis]ATF07742.1 hypothetical protein PhaeoP63_03709 [Phaeobacter gallaeciensis]